MQKGIVTFEIILGMLIVALLATKVLPNMDNALDKVMLDYEVKRIYTKLRYLRSFDKMANMADTHFGTGSGKDVVSLETFPKIYIIRQNARSPVKDYDTHQMPSGFTLTYENASHAPERIQFDDMGKIAPAISNSLHINSRLGKRFSIVFDSVGRFRGDRKK